ncbi:VMAP-C domain-containing protein [Dactylosporangium cerinum]
MQRSEPIPTPKDDVPAHPARLTADDVQMVAETWERESTASLETTIEWLTRRHIRVTGLPSGATQSQQIRAVVAACNDPAGFGTLADLRKAIDRLGLTATREALEDHLAGRPYSPIALLETVETHLPALRLLLRTIAQANEGAVLLKQVNRVWPRDGVYLPRAVPGLWIGLEWLAAQYPDLFAKVLFLLTKATGLPGNGELTKLATEHFPCDNPPPSQLDAVRTHLVVRISRVNSGQPETKYDVHIRLIEQHYDPDADRRLLGMVTTEGPRTTAATTLESTTTSMIDSVRKALTADLAWNSKDVSGRQVDFLLDTDLLSLGVDEWKVNLGRKTPRAIGVEAPVVVRPLERLRAPGGLDVGAWARRSRWMTDKGEARWAVAPEVRRAADEIPYAGDHTEVSRAIEDIGDNVVCLGLDAGQEAATTPLCSWTARSRKGSRSWCGPATGSSRCSAKW